MEINSSRQTRLGRIVVVTAVTAVVAGTLTALSVPASAAGTGAQLELHGPGSVYSGSATFASADVAAGSTSTFAMLVVNTGSATTQFKLRVNPLVDPNSIATYTVTAGAQTVTAQATDPDGFYTPPIAPNKTLAVSVKVTPPRTATPYDDFFTDVTVGDLHGTTTYDSVLTETVVKAATGTAADMFVTGSGQQSTLATGDYTNITDPALKVGQSATYTVKLQNDEASAVTLGLQMVDGSDCSAYFTPTIKVGSTNVTAAVLAGTYVTPVLAKGKNVSLAVSVKYVGVPPVESCDYPFDVEHLIAQPSDSEPLIANLITNMAVGQDQPSVGFGGPDETMVTPVVDDYAYQPNCIAGHPCPSQFLLAADGSATAEVAAGASPNAGYASEFFEPSTLPCTETGGAEAFEDYLSTADQVSQVDYTSYGQAADAAYAAGAGNDHICFASSLPFDGYYPASGHWTGSYANDADSYGAAPYDTHTGEYVALLPSCSTTAGVFPCVGGGSYLLTGARHSYSVIVNVAAGDQPQLSS